MSESVHRLQLDQIRDGERIDFNANAEELAAIAERLRLVSLDRLDAHTVLKRDGAMVKASGRLKASLSQACVATGEPVAQHIDEAFDLSFVPAPSAEEELELAADQLDTIFHDGQAIDLGTAIADTLALALDPYPRSPAADEALRQAGVLSEEEAGPFAALAALKAKLGGDQL